MVQYGVAWLCHRALTLEVALQAWEVDLPMYVTDRPGLLEANSRHPGWVFVVNQQTGLVEAYRDDDRDHRVLPVPSLIECERYVSLSEEAALGAQIGGLVLDLPRLVAANGRHPGWTFGYRRIGGLHVAFRRDPFAWTGPHPALHPVELAVSEREISQARGAPG
jgi:hypothetical protein